MLRRISDPLTTAAKLGVVSVADLKVHARITDTEADEDDLIGQMIAAAFDFLHGPDGWLNGCCILRETFEATSVSFGCEGLILEARPFAGSAVTSFEMLDDAGSYAAVPVDRYRLGFGPFYASLGAIGMSPLLPPIAYRQDPGAFRVRFEAGFADAATVPGDLKLAIKMLAGHWYANREATSSDNRAVPKRIELGLKALCRRHRLASDHS